MFFSHSINLDDDAIFLSWIMCWIQSIVSIIRIFIIIIIIIIIIRIFIFIISLCSVDYVSLYTLQISENEYASSEFQKPSLSDWGQVHNLSCENEFYLHDNENSFPYPRLST